MNETQVTMVGNAVEDPVKRTTRHGDAYVTVRMASTVRRKDAASGRYVDVGTNFVTVVAFRQLAVNMAESIRKGQPLVVTGRLRVNQWRTEDKSGTSVEIDATSVGHDLSKGTTQFTRVRPGQDHGSFPSQAPAAHSAEPWQGSPVGAEDDRSMPMDEDYLGGEPDEPFTEEMYAATEDEPVRG
ncbi:Single-stranded DNA-binding protein [Austwickia sp. TVS 96-490-7B]|uniref:single-stranded DNA-binding protein n=1 Tax=Austwickia sp. TVS 96-490-7B TaxID=2830843 RepID=UPI001C585F05|nr:single-stranded DNA-binding protein [Austwickia sp. TVS 96-490-7B]MBW3086535.1 Single-stranded DNA-binding protein [Austwickia sp. TVS 96-490-7B]